MLRSVLVVEDSVSGRQVIKHYLEHFGAQDITMAKDGEEALNLVRIHPSRYRYIFTDLHMPKVDGMQLLSRLGDLNYFGNVVIISKLEENIVKLSIELAKQKRVHLVGYVSKPIDESSIRAVVERLDKARLVKPTNPNYLKRRQIIEAMEQNRVVPYFQPKIDANTKAVVGFEVLARIQIEQEMELVLPERFIPVIEKFDLEHQLFDSMLNAAKVPIQHLLSLFPADYGLQLSFNVSPQLLEDESLPEKLKSFCQYMDISHQQLIVEVTEQDLINGYEKLVTIERLRINGFGLALDDFGTGFTNLGDLCRLPFTEVKLDQSFIFNVHQDALSQIILRALCEIAGELKIGIVAEGVENNKDFSYITDKTTASIQGYLVSRPKPATEIERWLTAWNNNWHIDLKYIN